METLTGLILFGVEDRIRDFVTETLGEGVEDFGTEEVFLSGLVLLGTPFFSFAGETGPLVLGLRE